MSIKNLARQKAGLVFFFVFRKINIRTSKLINITKWRHFFTEIHATRFTSNLFYLGNERDKSNDS